MSIKHKRLIVIFVFIIVVFSLINTIESTNGQLNDIIYWLNLGIHILLIGYLSKLLYPRYTSTLKRATVVLTLCSVYMALGTGLLHYQGEGGYENDLLQSSAGNKIQYYIELHNGLNIPVNIDCIFLCGERGLEKVSTASSKGNNEGTKDDMRGINLIFKVTETEATLPTKTVVTYRVFGFIPMVNVIELKWPEVNSV